LRQLVTDLLLEKVKVVAPQDDIECW